MKKQTTNLLLIVSLLVFGTVALFATVGNAQTNSITPSPTSIVKDTLQTILDHRTNVEVAVYGDYFLNNHKVGAGFLALYRLNSVLAVGAGADWAGEWRSISGNVSVNHTFALSGKLSLNTYAIAGALTSLGGAGGDNGLLATVEGGGAQFHYQVNDRWNIGLGSAYLQRQNCGSYSGGSIAGVFTINLGF